MQGSGPCGVGSNPTGAIPLICETMKLLTRKYQPKSLEEIIGNEKAKAQVKAWFLRALKQKEKPLLIWGPPGIGKTSTAYALAQQYGLELIEMNASELRDKAHVERKIGLAGEGLSLFGRGKLILIDDVDSFQREDRGGLSELVDVFKKCKWPIILTAADYWDKKLSPIRPYVVAVEYKRISPGQVLRLLERICNAEGIAIPKKVLEEIAERCEGDVRAAINDLYIRSPGFREREKDIFERMLIVFKSTTYKHARSAAWLVDHDFLKLWIEENIPREYTKKDDCAQAFDVLSRADVFDGRIMRRQYWGFLRYSSDLMTAGVALAKKEKYRKFTKYSFPNFLRLMSQSANMRKLRLSIAKKLGRMLHCGWREAVEFFPVLKQMLMRDEKVGEHLGLTKEERNFILERI